MLNIIYILKYINEEKIYSYRILFSLKNQFFVTGTYDSHIRNQVGDALYQRIERAHK